MEYRQLGGSGLRVPVLSFGTGTFGGGKGFDKWGNTEIGEATRLVELCIEAGVNLFDTADIYSQGLSEEILGKAIHGKRNDLIISTKATFRFGKAPNNEGSGRYHIMRQVEGSLRRLNTDHIDIYHIHGFDTYTPVEETLRTLDDLIQSGKVRYIAASNFSGWHMMKSIAVSEKNGWNRYVAHQVYYSLIGREYEWELMPLALDQKVGAMIWSPLAAGRLGGKYGRNKPLPKDSRVAMGGGPVPNEAFEQEVFFKTMDALEEIAAETDKTVPQIALNWLLQRPTVSTVVIGARNEEQLLQNFGATGWNLNAGQIKKLDDASFVPMIYPYWHQSQNPTLVPPIEFY